MGFSKQEYWSGVPLPSPNIPLVPSKRLTTSFRNYSIRRGISHFTCIFQRCRPQQGRSLIFVLNPSTIPLIWFKRWRNKYDTVERSLNLELNNHVKQNPWLVILDKRFPSFEPQFHYLTSEKSNPPPPLSHISQFFHGINEIRYLAEPCRKKICGHTSPAHSFYR